MARRPVEERRHLCSWTGGRVVSALRLSLSSTESESEERAIEAPMASFGGKSIQGMKSALERKSLAENAPKEAAAAAVAREAAEAKARLRNELPGYDEPG